MFIVPDRSEGRVSPGSRRRNVREAATVSHYLEGTDGLRYSQTSQVSFNVYCRTGQKCVCAVVRPLTLQHGITFLAAPICKTLVWNNEDNDSHILLASAKSLFGDFASPTIYSSLLHFWEGINLGFRSVALSNLEPELVGRDLRSRHVYSSELSCSLTRTTNLGASGRVRLSYPSSLTSALCICFLSSGR
jgi:hypothetical protein